MSDQLALSFGRARRGDPGTSHRAALEADRLNFCRPVGQCGWCRRAISYLTAGSTGICDECATNQIEDARGITLEVEREAEADRVARLKRGGVTP